MLENAWGVNLAVLASIGFAAAIQNLTGFAFGLVFMGLVSGLHLLPMGVAANTITLITILQSLIYLRQHHRHVQWKLLWPLAGPMQLGVGLGIAALALWSASNVNLLRPLLGLVIIGAAFSFAWPGARRTQPSPPWVMASTAALAGVLGGLFSTSGPPLVYLLYRQPWPLERIKASLTLLFGISQVVRLALLLGTGQFTAASIPWAVAAFPLLLLVGALHTRWGGGLPRKALERVVAVLLLLAGLGLLWQ